MPVGEMLGRMSAYEEAAWIQLYQIEPFGDHRADMRSAQISQLIYATNAGKRSPKKSLADFMPFFRKRAKEDENVEDNVRAVFGNILKHQSK